MNTDQIVSRIDRDLAEYNTLRAQSKWNDLSDLEDRDRGKRDKFIVQALATIEAVAPPGSAYLREARYRSKDDADYKARTIPILVGVLQALKDDYRAGFLRTVQEIIHADVFGDFLEMSEYLLSEGYKDPAAVLIGGVLEEHVRKMCIKNGIDITVTSHGKVVPKKASVMNDNLMTSGSYNSLQHKHITAWLDLRNKAAHGNYNDYRSQEVELMLQGVRNFILQYVA